jgi:hypothetical protein
VYSVVRAGEQTTEYTEYTEKNTESEMRTFEAE